MCDKNKVIKTATKLPRLFSYNLAMLPEGRGSVFPQGNIPSDGQSANLYFSLRRRRRTVTLAAVGSLRRRGI